MEIHHLTVLVENEHDTDAGIAYLTEGPGAPAMVLTISWPTGKAARTSMEIIKRCTTWTLTTDEHALTIVGRGHKKARNGGYIIPTFVSSWVMDDPDAVTFFEQLALAHGYFLVLPAVAKVLGEGAPVVCYLRKNKVTS